MQNIFLSAGSDPLVFLISVLSVLFVIIGLMLKKIDQPYIVGYILIGALVSEDGLGLIERTDSIQRLGEIGIILLLFFIGMEINLPDLIKQWKVALIGTFLQIVISSLLVLGIGEMIGWGENRSIVLGFVIALSSSAVIIKILEAQGKLESRLGKNILSILLMQDIVIVPLLIITAFLGGKTETFESVSLMLFGGVLLTGVMLYIYYKKELKLPFAESMKKDEELQVFAAIFYCFGGALVSSICGLSAGLGAFVGGMVMHASHATDWIHNTLHAFRVLFVAVFFISVGLQIDFAFLTENIYELVLVLIAVFLSNHVINTFILKVFGNPWKESIVGGAFLAQIGEMSFLLALSAFHAQIINDYGYNFTVCLISLTLVISPFWISLTEALVGKIRVLKD
jgi:CPA2 family monovalent cation:H+ antiporter-2